MDLEIIHNPAVGFADGSTGQYLEPMDQFLAFKEKNPNKEIKNLTYNAKDHHLKRQEVAGVLKFLSFRPCEKKLLKVHHKNIVQAITSFHFDKIDKSTILVNENQIEEIDPFELKMIKNNKKLEIIGECLDLNAVDDFMEKLIYLYLVGNKIKIDLSPNCSPEIIEKAKKFLVSYEFDLSIYKPIEPFKSLGVWQ